VSDVKRRWYAADFWVIAALLLTAFAAARWYLPKFRAAGGRSEFYQPEFGPAVMQACGRGFVDPVETDAVALNDFLHERSQRLACGDVPARLRTRALNPLQGVTRYLMVLVGLVWRAVGVRWDAVDIVTAGFVGASVAAAYAALRLVTGRWLALLTTAWWAWSPRHLENIPHLRDYSKTPFFMVMLIAVAIAIVEARPRWLIGAGVAFGAIQGLGFGMRTDIILNFVPFFVVLFAATRADLKPRIVTAIATVAVFVAVSYPVVRTYARNSSLWHVALLGFTSPYDENLNIGYPRPVYSFPYAHNDNYIAAVVQAYWRRLHPDGAPVVILTPGYDQACRRYFETIARIFPADVVARMISSAIHIANLPFLTDSDVPLGVHAAPLVSAFTARAALMKAMNGSGPLLLGAVLFALGLWYLRAAAVAAALFAMFLTYPFIEFQGRHIFHLEFLVLAAVAAGGTLLVRTVRAARRSPSTASAGVRALRSAVACAACAAAAAATLAVARVVQVPRARAFTTSYLDAPTTALHPTALAVGSDRLRLLLDLFGPRAGKDDVQEVLVRADFTPDRCTPSTPLVPVTFRYEDGDPRFGLNPSRDLDLELFGAGTATHAFLPVYAIWRDWTLMSRFVGVEMPRALADCVQFSIVNDVRPMPLLLPVTVTPDWTAKLYERVRLVPVPLS